MTGKGQLLKKRLPFAPLAPKSERPPLPSRNPQVSVLVIYRDNVGNVARKSQPWRRGITTNALREWVEDYHHRLADGYKPAGFSTPPRIHCARLLIDGKVTAEWISTRLRPAESLVTAGSASASGEPSSHGELQDDNATLPQDSRGLTTITVGRELTTGAERGAQSSGLSGSSHSTP